MPRLDDEPSPLQFQINALDVSIVAGERPAHPGADARRRSRELGMRLPVHQRVEDGLGRGFDDYLMLDIPGHCQIGFMSLNAVRRPHWHWSIIFRNQPSATENHGGEKLYSRKSIAHVRQPC